jgi:integrase
LCPGAWPGNLRKLPWWEGERHRRQSISAALADRARFAFHREQQQEHRRLFGVDYKNLDLIFCEPDGNYHQPDLVSQVIIRRIRKAGIKNGSFHTLRHSHASNLLSHGVPLPAVSARLGHADTNVTARIYAHALPADDQRSADAWDAIIKGPLQ